MDLLTSEEQKQSDEALKYLKSNKREFFDRLADKSTYLSDTVSVSLFMAGSPGAGKTEMSKRLTEIFKSKPIRIDADEIREFFPEYKGTNSYIFQHAADKGINMLLDYALHKNINFILDATFAYAEAEKISEGA